MSFNIKTLTRRGLGLMAGAAVVASGLAVVPARADEVVIPIIVKDTTSFYWQIVLAGARKAGKDLGVNVPELGAQSEADINGQIIDPRKRRRRQAGRHRHRADRVRRARQADRRGRQVGQDHRHRLRRRLQGLHLVPDHRQRPGRPHRRRRPGRRHHREVRQGRGRSRARSPICRASARSISAPRASRSSSPRNIRASSSSPTRSSDGPANGGLNITTDLLTANPNLRGIFASNLIMAQGAGQAIAENKAQDKVKLIGFDSDDKLVKAPQGRRDRRRSSSRTPTAWAMTASRPRSPPPRARRSRRSSTPART